LPSLLRPKKKRGALPARFVHVADAPARVVREQRIDL
jgi:hypothetical protein